MQGSDVIIVIPFHRIQFKDCSSCFQLSLLDTLQNTGLENYSIMGLLVGGGLLLLHDFAEYFTCLFYMAFLIMRIFILSVCCFQNSQIVYGKSHLFLLNVRKNQIAHHLGTLVEMILLKSWFGIKITFKKKRRI